MSNNTSVIAIVTVYSNKCDVCGKALENPNHRFCKDHFKKPQKSSKPAAVAPTAPAPVAVTAPVVESAAPVANPAPAPVEAPKPLSLASDVAKAETKPAVVTPVAAPAPAARPAPERPAHIKVVTCGCGQKFVPRDPRHTKCATCFKKVIAERKAAEAKRELENAAGNAERQRKADLLKKFREGALPEGAKVSVNGAQVVIVINGVSTTLYDHEGYNARREAARYAEALKAKAAADKARADAEKAAAAKARHDRAAKALFQTLQSGKTMPPTVTVKRSGVNVIFTVSVVGKPTTTYTAVDPDLAAAEDAARKSAEAIAKAARKEQEKKGGKKGKKAA